MQRRQGLRMDGNASTRMRHILFLGASPARLIGATEASSLHTRAGPWLLLSSSSSSAFSVRVLSTARQGCTRTHRPLLRQQQQQQQQQQQKTLWGAAAGAPQHVPRCRGLWPLIQKRNNSSTVERARAAYERFKERKTEMVVLYGSTFLVVHELLGIASYAIAYGLLASGVIDIEHVAGYLGITEEDAQKRGFSLHDRMVTFGMTIALVKALDVMGLVPLRWFINFLITPRIARYVGPRADKVFHAIKRISTRSRSKSS